MTDSNEQTGGDRAQDDQAEVGDQSQDDRPEFDNPAQDGLAQDGLVPGDTATAGGQAQKVTWAELFFDLAWVFAITQIAGALAGSHGVADMLRVLVLLLPLWWGWVGTTILDNVAGSELDRVRGRLVLFGMAGCGLAMSVAIPMAYGDRAVLFVIACVVMRTALWLESRRQGRHFGTKMQPFSIALFGGGPLYLAGMLAPAPWREILWAAAGVLIVAGPALVGRVPQMARLRFDVSHLPERFGLFIILALGETVVAMSGQAAGGRLGAGELVALGLGYAVILTLWWTYFHFGESAIRHRLQTSVEERAIIVRDVLSYGHFGFVAGIVCVAVGLKKLLAHPLDVPHELPEFLLAPGAALYLATFCYTRARMFGAPLLPRTAGTVVLLLVVPATFFLPHLAIAGVVLLVLVAVNAVEAWVVVTGRKPIEVRLTRRPAG